MNEILPKYDLSFLDCAVYQIFERRDLLSGRLDTYNHPYEIVISAPESMGEHGIMISMYYDELPTREKLYEDARKELKDWIRPENFLMAGIYTPTYYDEYRIKAIKKALRTSPRGL